MGWMREELVPLAEEGLEFPVAIWAGSNI